MIIGNERERLLHQMGEIGATGYWPGWVGAVSLKGHYWAIQSDALTSTVLLALADGDDDYLLRHWPLRNEGRQIVGVSAEHCHAALLSMAAIVGPVDPKLFPIRFVALRRYLRPIVDTRPWERKPAWWQPLRVVSLQET